MAFKDLARIKQIDFKNQKLELFEKGQRGGIEYDQILASKDALEGANYYTYKTADWSKLKDWALAQEKVAFSSYGLSDMLRSQHIAYNIAYPLYKLQQEDPALLTSFLNGLMPVLKLKSVLAIKVEYAGALHPKDLLDDKTSFDIYLEYLNEAEEKGILGIEVKYTETSYAWGITERKRMKDKSSIYFEVARISGVYNDDWLEKGDVSKILKQPFRNHLLGLALQQQGACQHFYSVHLYPNFNTYQQKTVKCYLSCLKHESQELFVPITYEDFIELGLSMLQSPWQQDWLNYLKDRYIFK